MVSYWILRQNYAEMTNQSHIMDLIQTKQIITCPWGGWGEARQNIVDGKYNESTSDRSGRPSSGQDRKFVESMKVGDIILIPFTGFEHCIIARITSSVNYAIDTGLYWKEDDGQINMSFNKGTPFRPVGRHIEIIDRNYIPPSRRLGQWTLCKMNKDLTVQLKMRYSI